MWGSMMELPCCKNGMCPQSSPPPEGELLHRMEEGRLYDDPPNSNPVDQHIYFLSVLHQLPLIGRFVEFIFGR